MVKHITISIIISIVAYAILALIQGGNFVPSTLPDILSLATLLAAVLAASLLAAGASNAPKARAATPKKASSKSASSDQESGTVKWFNIKKGYGFITRDQGDDVFVHYRNIEGQGRRAINEGQRVRFVVIDGDKGLQADEVETI